MKKVFIISSDIMALCVGIMVCSSIAWIVGEFAYTDIVRAAKTLLVGSALVFAAATITSYASWRRGGAPDDDGEGQK